LVTLWQIMVRITDPEPGKQTNIREQRYTLHATSMYILGPGLEFLSLALERVLSFQFPFILRAPAVTQV